MWLQKFKTSTRNRGENENKDENENKENNRIENNSPNNITLRDNTFNEMGVSYNEAIKKLVYGKNKTSIDKNTKKDKPNIGKGEEDSPEDLNNKRLSEIEGLLKLDFQTKFTSLKTGRNDFIIKERSDEQLNKCSLFIEDILIAKEMCDNDSGNLDKEIKFTNEEAQRRANLYFRMKVKYDFVMEKVLSFINSMLEISDTEKENDSNKNLMVESENIMEGVVSVENSMREISDNEKETDSNKIVMLESEIKLESLVEKRIEEVKQMKINNKTLRLQQMYKPTTLHTNKCHICGLIFKARHSLIRHIVIDHKRKRNSGTYEDTSLVHTINETIQTSSESSDENTSLKQERHYGNKHSISNTSDLDTNSKGFQGDFDKEKLILTKSDEDKERFRAIVDSMLTMISLDEGYKCLVCYKEFVGRPSIVRKNATSHIDHHHTHNLLHKCHICSLIVKTSDKLTRHIGKIHKNILYPVNKKLKGTKFERKKMASTSISTSNLTSKQIIMNTEGGKIEKEKPSLPSNENDNISDLTSKQIILNTEGEKIEKEKLALPSNENDNISQLISQLKSDINSKCTISSKMDTHLIEKTINIDSLQGPIALKFNNPISQRDKPQMVEQIMKSAEIGTVPHNEASKNIKRKNNTKYDNENKIILTKSDEDKAIFQLIVEGMIRKNSLGEGYKCLMCNREFGGPHAKPHAMAHVDHKHTDNLLHKCPICDLILKNRDALTRHIGKFHKNKSK